MDRLRAVHRLLGLVLLAGLVTACSGVPNMDHGSAGCSNARGIGPHGEAAGDVAAVEAFPPAIGLAPTEAARIAAAAGHTVVFNVQIPSYGECWCIPPPEGEVVMTWWNDHGALFMAVDGVDVGHTADEQPFFGWGC